MAPCGGSLHPVDWREWTSIITPIRVHSVSLYSTSLNDCVHHSHTTSASQQDIYVSYTACHLSYRTCHTRGMYRILLRSAYAVTLHNGPRRPQASCRSLNHNDLPVTLHVGRKEARSYSVFPLLHSSAATGGLFVTVPIDRCSSLQVVAVCHVHRPRRHSSAHLRSLNFDDLAVVLYARHEEASIVLCTAPFAILCCSGRAARVDRRPLPLLAPPCNLHRIGVCPAFTPKLQSTCLEGSECFRGVSASCVLTHAGGEAYSRVRCSVRRLRHRCSRQLLERRRFDSSTRRRRRRRSGSTHFSGIAAQPQVDVFPACTPALGGRAQSHVTIPNIHEYAGVFSFG